MKRIINTITLFCLILAGCSMASLPDSQITPSIIATETFMTGTIVSPPQTEDGTKQPIQPEPLSYEFLSPFMIRNKAKTMTFEVSATLTQTTFQFRVDALVPPEFEFSYPDYIYPDIYKSLELSFSPSLEIEQIGGGGGSETVDGAFSLNTERDYQIKSPITIGQNIHLTAIISFGEFTGIRDPVPFEMVLTVN